MKKVSAFFKDHTINLVSEHDNSVIKVAPNALPKQINQDFVWVDDVIQAENAQLPCALKKINDDFDLGNAARDVYYQGKVEKHINLFLAGTRIYYVCSDDTQLFPSLEEIVETESNKSNLDALRSVFENLDYNTYYLAGSDTRALVAKLLGSPLSVTYLKDSLQDNAAETLFTQIANNHQNLALKLLNKIVGYGVIALADIPANTAVTFYAGFLGAKPDINDDYQLTVDNKTINSARHHRNFGGFISHAFPNATHSSHCIVIEDFKNKENTPNWHATILSANLTRSTIHYHGNPYTIFTNPEIILAGTVLAFNYSTEYWTSIKTCPALLTLSGQLIDPNSYTVPPALHCDDETQSVLRC